MARSDDSVKAPSDRDAESAPRLFAAHFQRSGAADRGLSPRRAQHRPPPAPKKRETVDDHPDQNSDACGGPRGPERGRGRRLLPTLPPVRENALDKRDIGELLRVCA